MLDRTTSEKYKKTTLIFLFIYSEVCINTMSCPDMFSIPECNSASSVPVFKYKCLILILFLGNFLNHKRARPLFCVLRTCIYNYRPCPQHFCTPMGNWPSFPVHDEVPAYNWKYLSRLLCMYYDRTCPLVSSTNKLSTCFLVHVHYASCR